MLRLRLGPREQALLLGGAVLLEARQLLQDARFRLLEIAGLELGLDVEDARELHGGVAHADPRDEPLAVAQSLGQPRALGAAQDGGDEVEAEAGRIRETRSLPAESALH